MYNLKDFIREELTLKKKTKNKQTNKQTTERWRLFTESAYEKMIQAVEKQICRVQKMKRTKCQVLVKRTGVGERSYN